MSSDPFFPPIRNPVEEREILERDGRGAWLDWLRESTKIRGIFASHPLDEDRRVAEVYRRCFVNSKNADTSIIGNFAAHFPRIALSGTWLPAALREWSDKNSCESGKSRVNRFLKDIGAGFRRAATRPYGKTAFRPGKLRAARTFRVQKQDELRCFLDPLRDAEEKWREEQLRQKVSELTTQYRLKSPAASRLGNYLLSNRTYDASVLLAAAAFRVRERDLESK
jgi:hypothetical protein